jgi:hypothetical protein
MHISIACILVPSIFAMIIIVHVASTTIVDLMIALLLRANLLNILSSNS